MSVGRMVPWLPDALCLAYTQAIYIRRVEPEQTTGHPAEIEAAVEEARALGVPLHVCASSAEMETLLRLG